MKIQDILIKVCGFFVGMIIGFFVIFLWRFFLFIYFGWPFSGYGLTPLIIILGFGYLGWKNINRIITKVKTFSIAHLGKKTGRLQIVFFICRDRELQANIITIQQLAALFVSWQHIIKSDYCTFTKK